MKRKSLFAILLIFSIACERPDNTTTSNSEIDIVPIPKEVTVNSENEGLLFLDNISVYYKEKKISNLVSVLESDIKKSTSIDINLKKSITASADIVFEIDSDLAKEEYELDITDNIVLKGGSYGALAMAKSSLLQIMNHVNQSIVFPKINIKDHPDSEYRGLLIDLARMYHDIPTLKQIIDLAAYYKVNYLQLHLSDDQSFTFPSEKYPKLATPDRPYSKKDFRDLVDYADNRGVIIIPEFDVPGHSYQLVQVYPEIFGVKNNYLQIDTKKSNVVNIASEKAYKALDEIIGEMIEVFDTSPYFHIGGDEAWLPHYENVPEVEAFMEKHNLENVHELFRYFLVRMNETVKKYDKQMFVWEGFRREGTIEIPKDVVVFGFETMYQLPSHLLEDGYSMVNTSWTPLYLVNGGVKNTRAQRAMWSPEYIYSWNKWRWEHWWDQTPVYKKPMQLEKTPLVIGGQMCSWEQAGEAEIPTLRKRLPTFIERVWNEDEVIPFKDFFKKVEVNDSRLSKIINDKRQDTLLLGYDFDGDCLWCN